MSRHRIGLGSEHPYCDRIQNAMIILFLVIWGVDSFILNYSTLLAKMIPLALRILLSVLSLGIDTYLVSRSHRLALHEADGQPKLADSGVYSWIRHPMYLGTLILFLGFFFAIPSLLSLAVLILFFAFYNKMATYEETDLVKRLGEEYAAYQKRVPKWIPRFTRRR